MSLSPNPPFSRTVQDISYKERGVHDINIVPEVAAAILRNERTAVVVPHTANIQKGDYLHFRAISLTFNSNPAIFHPIFDKIFEATCVFSVSNCISPQSVVCFVPRPHLHFKEGGFGLNQYLDDTIEQDPPSLPPPQST